MQLSNYIARHMQAALNSLGKISRAPFSTLATCLVIGIALALPTSLVIVLKNAERISGSFQQTAQLTLYIKQGVAESRILDLAKQLKNNPKIEETQLISPTDGLQELQKLAGFDKGLENLQNNPLPWVIVVFPHAFKKAGALEQLGEELKKLPEVENVQLDMLWVKRLALLVKLAHRVTYALAIFLGMAVLLIVNNTIRSATQQHQKEIEIIQLIGGTPSFIRRPFLYTGMAYGLLGGITAWQLVDFLILFLKTPVNNLARLYDSPFELTSMGLSSTMLLLLSSVILGFIGSWLAVTKHLREMNA